jgi:hypothetical protein
MRTSRFPFPLPGFPLSVATALLLGGCGGSPSAPPAGPPVEVELPPAPEVTEGEADGEAGGGSDEGDSPATVACASAYECTLVQDHCGRIHGAPLSRPVPPEVHPACRAARQARMRPVCEEGVCVAQQIEDPDWTSCHTSADCMTIAWPCSPPIAIGRIHRAEAEAVAAANAQSRACRAPADTRTPAVECLMGACVARAPR